MRRGMLRVRPLVGTAAPLAVGVVGVVPLLRAAVLVGRRHGRRVDGRHARRPLGIRSNPRPPAALGAAAHTPLR